MFLCGLIQYVYSTVAYKDEALVMVWTIVRDVETEVRFERTEAWGAQSFKVRIDEVLKEESKRLKGITKVREAKEMVLLKRSDEWCQHFG